MDEEIHIARQRTIATLAQEAVVEGVLTPHGLRELPDALERVTAATPDQLKAYICRARLGLGRLLK